MESTTFIDRDPGGSSLVGKVNFFFQAYVFPSMETHVWLGLAGGCGQEGQYNGGPAKLD